MSQTTPTPDIPKPSIPKPNIPKPNIPAPNVNRTADSAPVSMVEMGAMEAPVKPAPEEEIEESQAYDYTETLLPQRLLAGVIDGAVAFALVWVLGLVLPDFLNRFPYGIFIAYLLFKDSLPFLNGQSVGKKVTKIQAVAEDGTPLTKDITKGIIRNVFVAIPILAVVELFILNSREKTPSKGSRLGDDFAKTKVIEVKETASQTTDAAE
ncbi:RDD family protein [Roseibacillus persicicus]|uniref:RDD family protein n=1 Tax=Roseibacillus persicicus TaxID=454148 RepID=UPI00398AA753